jgi:hypothetical protein
VEYLGLYNKPTTVVLTGAFVLMGSRGEEEEEEEEKKRKKTRRIFSQVQHVLGLTLGDERRR